MSKQQKERAFGKLCEEIITLAYPRHLADIHEVTYAYYPFQEHGKEYFFNITLFSVFLQLDTSIFQTSGNINTQQYIIDNKHTLRKEAHTSLTLYRNVLQNCHEKITHFPYQELTEELLFLKNALSYITTLTEMAFGALPFEGEKMGIPHHLSDAEVRKRTREIDVLEKEVFGGKVADNPQEVRVAYEALGKIYMRYQDLLSPEEQSQFFAYAERLREYCSDMEDFLSLDISEPAPKTLDIPIPRDTYAQIFQKVITLYGLHQEVRIEPRSSVYDGEYLGIPDSDAYAFLSLARVLELIAHEIETHYILSENSKKLIDNMRGAKNLDREEGLAMTTERMLFGKPLSTKTLALTIMSEILNGDELKKFLHLYTKLTQKGDSKALFLRRKRNYPFHIPGTHHKDTTYYRGQKRIHDEYIIPGKNMSDLYFGKVSFEDIPFLKKLAKEKNIQIQYPYFIGDMLQYMLLENCSQYSSHVTGYIEKKYTLFLPENIHIVLSNEQKKILGDILRILKTYMKKEE